MLRLILGLLDIFDIHEQDAPAVIGAIICIVLNIAAVVVLFLKGWSLSGSWTASTALAVVGIGALILGMVISILIPRDRS